MRHDHADRAGPAGRLGENRVRLVADGHRDIVAAAGRDAAHADDDRNVSILDQLAKVMVDKIASGHAAAWGIDAEDHGLDVFVLHGGVDRAFDEAVLGLHDDALDGNDGDLVLGVGVVRDEFLLHAAFAHEACDQPRHHEVHEQRADEDQHEKREEQPPPKAAAAAEAD